MKRRRSGPWWLGIDWTGFGRTAHWLRGLALFDYILREEYLAGISATLNEPTLLRRWL